MLEKKTPAEPFRLEGIEGGDTDTVRILLKLIYLWCIGNQQVVVRDSLPKLMSLAECLQIQCVKDACKMLLNECLARTEVG